MGVYGRGVAGAWAVTRARPTWGRFAPDDLETVGRDGFMAGHAQRGWVGPLGARVAAPGRFGARA